MKLYSIIIDKQTNKQKCTSNITQTGLPNDNIKLNTTYSKENTKIIHLNLLANDDIKSSDKEVFEKMLDKEGWHGFE